MKDKLKRVLPDAFEWVYVYIGARSGHVGYIGRAKNAERCMKRIFEHRRDNWYLTEKWDVAFIPCINRFESETLETIYINKYHPLWNIAKTGWGLPEHDDSVDIRFLQHIKENSLNNDALLLDYLYTKEWGIKELMIQDGKWERREA